MSDTNTTTVAVASAPSTSTTGPASGYAAQTWEREPRAVVLLEPGDVQLGDVLVDAFGGQLLVEEVVRRSYEPRFEFAAFRPRRSFADPPVLDRRRVITRSGALLRVARRLDHFGPLSGHHSRVRSHNPVRQGCYTLVDGWRAECSCGWPGEQPQIHGSQSQARLAWRIHKATVITIHTCDSHPGYLHIAYAEGGHHPLPPVPWSFVKHNGLAHARLDEIPLPEARQIAAAWAQAFGVEVSEGPTAYQDTIMLSVELLKADDRGAATAIASLRGYYPADSEPQAA